MKIDLVDELSTTEAVPNEELLPAVTYALNLTVLAVVHKYLPVELIGLLNVACAVILVTLIEPPWPVVEAVALA